MAEDPLVDLGVDVREHDVVQHGIAAMGETLGDGLLDRRGRAADQGQEAAPADRSALDERDWGALEEGVGRDDPDGDVPEFEHGDGGVPFHHVILK